MPTVRVSDAGEGEGEGLDAGRRSVDRIASNVALSDHIGKYIAGEVHHNFNAENLADRLKGKNAIHVSFSWG